MNEYVFPFNDLNNNEVEKCLLLKSRTKKHLFDNIKTFRPLQLSDDSDDSDLNPFQAQQRSCEYVTIE